MGEQDLLESMRETIRRHQMVRPGDRIVVAVSGGPDSLALLHGLWTLRRELSVSLHVAHLNHHLRGESAAAEARFVRGQAEALGLPVTLGEARVADLARSRRLSVEEAGREARYAFLRQVMEAVGGQKVALGHQRDDQAETVLMRLLRGTGPAGLGGIPPIREGWIIRPLIDVPRAAIEDYCRRAGLAPRRDASNETAAFLRNRVRHDLIPHLEQTYNPELRRSLARVAELAQVEESWLAALTREAYGQYAREVFGRVEFSLTGWMNLPLALRRRLIRLAAIRLLDHPVPLGFDPVERVLALAEAGTGASLDLPGGLSVRKGYQALVMERAGRRPAPFAGGFAYSLPVPGQVAIPEAGLRLEGEILPVDAVADEVFSKAGGDPGVAWFDADLVPLPLLVRSRRRGDRFRPVGLGVEMKLKNFFIHQKIPREERDRVPLVIANGEILWVAGCRPADRYRLTPQTRHCLLLRVTPLVNNNNHSHLCSQGGVC